MSKTLKEFLMPLVPTSIVKQSNRFLDYHYEHTKLIQGFFYPAIEEVKNDESLTENQRNQQIEELNFRFKRNKNLIGRERIGRIGCSIMPIILEASTYAKPLFEFYNGIQENNFDGFTFYTTAAVFLRYISYGTFKIMADKRGKDVKRFESNLTKLSKPN